MAQWILTSCLLILAVLLIRAVGKDKLSARVRYALWALVLLRLLVPFSVGESALSVQNWLPEEQSVELTDEELERYASSYIDVEMIENEPQAVPQTEASAERWDTEQILLMVYGIGCILVGGVFLVSNVRFALALGRSRRFIIRNTLPVYETAAVDAPCLFGLLPKIYVTSSVLEDENTLRHVLAHELTHYRHGDHIWSLLRCVCVTIHWYNPLVWIAAIISQQDGELACDEGALCRLGNEERTDYARTLLDMTCVGYKGMLTAATSMTGSESDLKTRIKRIAANPKMSAIAVVIVLAAAILVSLAVFTAAKAPAIEGVWRMELSYLGAGVNEPASAYMEYEFYDGRGLRTDYIGDEIRSAEAYGYALDGDEIVITFAENPRTETYHWSVENHTLILREAEREMVLTAVERNSVPYLPDGFVSIHYLFSTNNPAGLHYVPDETTQAKLLALLRSGEMKTVGAYGKNGVPSEEYLYILHHDEGDLIIADDMVVAENSLFKDGYALSNIAEIKELLDGLPWELSGQPTEGEVIGTMADVGDVVRVQNDVMEPTYLSDEAEETMVSLLAQGIGEAIGEEEIAFDTTYYTIISSGLNPEEDMVTLSDNGSLYMDGVRYELSNADALLRLLDAQFGIEIAHDGSAIEYDWTGNVGEDVYLELQGVTEEGTVIWHSSDDAVCTVAGDAYGATVTFTGVGEAQITAEWQGRWNTKGYTIMICCE